MRFIFCLHHHVPEGQFEDVIERTFQNAYAPTLEAIHEHPGVKVVLHHSGGLLEWLLKRHPEYVERVSSLVERGQVELLSSPIYEPILSAIPERERVAQIRAHQDLLVGTFGVAPRGAWLAERVWEPSLPKVLAEAGIEYVPLDDTPFLRVGFSEKRLYESYVTEDEGLPVRVFPTPQRLRALIPFAKPEEVVTRLLKRHTLGARVAVFADDGEKFGAWPGTTRPVRDGRWLSRFFALLLGEPDRIQTCTFADYVDSTPPAGAVYLPTGANRALLEWSISPAAQRRHHRLRTRLEQEGDGADRMLGIGYWRNFLVRYPEANWMHKRGLDLSRRLSALEARGADPERLDTARRHLWRSQCHTAYWHGAFGGLYMPHLRKAVHRNLLAAWSILDDLEHGGGAFLRLSDRDIDLDGRDEVLLENRHVALTFTPEDGGALVAIDVKRRGVNLLDVVARREEAYHKAIRENVADAQGSLAEPIDSRIRGGSDPFAKNLNYDPFPLYSFRDHLLPADTNLRSLKDLRSLSAPPARSRMSWQREEEGTILFRTAFRAGDKPVVLERTVSLDPDRPCLRVAWRVETVEGLPDRTDGFATELALGAPGVDPAGRVFETNGGSPTGFDLAEETNAVDRFRCAEAGVPIVFTVRLTPAARLIRFPIETVSLSETGTECIFQGARVFVAWGLDASRTRHEASLEMTID